MKPETAFYPKWYSAQTALYNALKLTPDQAHILDQWMRRHIFEVGVIHSIDNRLLDKRGDLDLEKEVRYINMRRLAERIYDDGLYSEERERGGFKTDFMHRVLVVGVPTLVGGPKDDRKATAQQAVTQKRDE